MTRSRASFLLLAVLRLSLAPLGAALFTDCAAVKRSSPGGSGGSGSGGDPGGDAGAPDSGTGGRISIASPDAGDLDQKFTSDTNEDATCGFDSFDLRRMPVDLFVVLDRSASMKDDSKGDDADPDAGRPSKWSQVVPALVEAISTSDPSISWGLKTFPEDIPGSTAECQDDSVTSAIDVPVRAANAAQISGAVQNVLPEGNGTPTGAALDVALAYLQGLGTNDRKYILLATDGEPSCSGTAGQLDKDSSDAKADAVAAVTAAASGDVHTFVIGVATKSGATSTLNQLAAAGLEPRVTSSDAEPKFYLASTESELVAALQAIVSPIASTCVFELAHAPPDPTNIAVKVGDTKAPQDPAHHDGWDYADGGHERIEVYGSWCSRVSSGTNMVQVVYGCPGFIIP
jgi:hypothetical protein